MDGENPQTRGLIGQIEWGRLNYVNAYLRFPLMAWIWIGGSPKTTRAVAGTLVQSLDELHSPAWRWWGCTAGMQLEFTSVVAGGGLGRLQRQRSEVPEGRRWWGTNWSFVWWNLQAIEEAAAIRGSRAAMAERRRLRWVAHRASCPAKNQGISITVDRN